jgi:polyhydroxyalkanoate synthesis regulator phasin
MNLDQVKMILANIVQQGDSNFAPAAQFCQQVVQAAESGQMSNDEIKESLLDVQRQISIMQDMSSLQLKENLNMCINALITIAGFVV